MNAEDRKILTKQGKILERLDERSLNTWRTVEKNEQHLIRQNGTLHDHEGRIASIEGASGVGLKTKIGGGIGALGIVVWNFIMWFRQQPPG